jgi:hypothetical protein
VQRFALFFGLMAVMYALVRVGSGAFTAGAGGDPTVIAALACAIASVLVIALFAVGIASKADGWLAAFRVALCEWGGVESLAPRRAA